ncbi:hypothetical protein F8S13_13785 [Chloroflexia bacterium SDU3-3]|nr:hypothetical protein F8S13_13785 [Chloroflexia bacterium SDU3-3]
MSYQHKSYGWVVVCNVCNEFGPIGDRYLRRMEGGTDEDPIHLCAKCASIAMWCDAHQTYHLPDSLHRHACADCGGLFTSVVSEQIYRCPSCQRSHAPEAPAPRPKAAARYAEPSLLEMVGQWISTLRP